MRVVPATDEHGRPGLQQRDGGGVVRGGVEPEHAVRPGAQPLPAPTNGTIACISNHARALVDHCVHASHGYSGRHHTSHSNRAKRSASHAHDRVPRALLPALEPVAGQRPERAPERLPPARCRARATRRRRAASVRTTSGPPMLAMPNAHARGRERAHEHRERERADEPAQPEHPRRVRRLARRGDTVDGGHERRPEGPGEGEAEEQGGDACHGISGSGTARRRAWRA